MKGILFVLILFVVACAQQVENNGPVVFINNQDLVVKDSFYLFASQPFTGDIITATNPELNEAMIQVKNGKLHGKVLKWDPDHIPRLEKNYQNGKEHGLQKGYHEGGQLSYEYNAEDGIRLGDYKEYYPSGQLQIHKYYDKGDEVKTKILDVNGKVIANYVLKDGEYYGLMGSSNCISVINENLH